LKKVLIILSIIFVSAFLFCGSVSVATGSSTNTQPVIKNVNPSNNAVNVPLNKVIKVTFNKPIKLGTKPWIELKNTRWGSKPFTAKTSSNVLSITPKSILAYGTEYYVILHSNSIKDAAGNGLASPYKFKFKSDIGLKVTSTIPLNNAWNIPTTKLIRITFNKPIKNPSNSLIQLKSTLGTLIPITFSITKNSLYIYHSPFKKKHSIQNYIKT
jgi:hypothetical protein